MQTSTRLCHAVIAAALLTATASGVPMLVAARGSTPPPVAGAACPDPAVPCAEAMAAAPGASTVTPAEPALSVPLVPAPAATTPGATVPGGTVAVPGGSVVVPGGTVTVPGGTVVAPGGTVIVPGGTVVVPGGTGILPGGDVPGGGVTVPDGRVVTPEGDVTGRGGTVTGPGTIPGGTVGPPAGGPGELLWSADFEGGDLRGFDHTPWNQVGSGAPRIVGLGNGTKALSLTIPAGGARNEVVPDMASLREGDDLYFGFSTHLVPGFPVDGPWQILAQWKNDGTGSPPVELKVERGRFLLDGGYGYPGGNRHFQHDLGPAVTGRWTNWVFHIRFSDNPGSGYVEVWRDGQQATARVAPPGGTLYPGLDSYLKIGYYRNSGIGTTGTAVHDNWRIGTTYAAVSSAGAAPSGGVAAPGAVPTTPAPATRSTAPSSTAPSRTPVAPVPVTPAPTVTRPPAARPTVTAPGTTTTPPRPTTPHPTSTTPAVTPSPTAPVSGAELPTEPTEAASVTVQTPAAPAG